MNNKTAEKKYNGFDPVDTDDWKRCPFCNGEPRAVVIEVHDAKYDTDWTGIATCHDCRVKFVVGSKTRDELIAKMHQLWNTRYERTCVYKRNAFEIDFKNPGAVPEDIYTCSECSCRMYWPPKYCPECGAKVMDE